MSNRKLDTAAKNCQAYRKYLKERGIPPHLATKGFLITDEMIQNLMAQNGGKINGIRIYVGLDESTEAKEIKPYAVACVKNGDTYHDYNDFNVPRRKPQAIDPSLASTTTSSDAASTLTATSISTETTTDPVVEEPRPCPSYCSQENELNTDQ